MTEPTEDPCAVLAGLEAARRDIAMGKAPRRVRYRTSAGAEQELENHAPNLAALDADIRRYRDLCARARGLKPQRFAATAG